MTNIFEGASIETQCIKLWDEYLRQYERVDATEVAEQIKQNPKYTVHAVDKAMKAARKSIKEALLDMGLVLGEETDSEDKRKLLTFYPAANRDPFHNLRMEAVLHAAMLGKNPCRIVYSPSFQGEEKHIFHPQFFHSYNGRRFVYGEYDNQVQARPFEVLPLDRILEAKVLKDVPYKSCPDRASEPTEYYVNQLKDVVGASPNFKDPTVYDVRIQTLDNKTHMRIMTKPIHSSQVEVKPCGGFGDPGEICIHVQMKNELKALLLSFGRAIEVLSPQELRDHIATVSDSLDTRYNGPKERKGPQG